MPPSSRYFDPEMRERLRRRLLERGTILATLLAEVLAGKDKTSALQALGNLRPGIRPEEALRKALDQMEHPRLLLVSNDNRHGCCEICGIRSRRGGARRDAVSRSVPRTRGIVRLREW